MSGPKTNGGMVWSNPITAILKADPVNSYTNHSRATLFMLSPIWEMAWPENSKLKFLVLSNSHPEPTRPSIALSFSAIAKALLSILLTIHHSHPPYNHSMYHTKNLKLRQPAPCLLPLETHPHLRTGRENRRGRETRARGLCIAGFIEHPFIYLEIILRHSFHSKPLFEGPAASLTVDFRNTLWSRRHLVESFADESSASALDTLRNRPAPIGQHGCSAGQRFNQYETKRFWPVIRTD